MQNEEKVIALAQVPGADAFISKMEDISDWHIVINYRNDIVKNLQLAKKYKYVSKGIFSVRVYKPNNLEKKKKKHKCLVYFHGGGFVRGGKVQLLDFFISRLAYECKCIIVNVEYRLAPEFV